MKFCLIAITAALIVAGVNSEQPHDDDFEFVSDNSAQQQKNSNLEKKSQKWIHDPSNDLCKPLNCKKKELCLLEDLQTAVCVSKKELHKNNFKFLEVEAKRKAEAVDNEEPLPEPLFYDSKIGNMEGDCKPCQPSKQFVCGSDNKTYSSSCRLNYHNCLHETKIKTSCKGFCPCIDMTQKGASRLKTLKAKIKKTIVDSFTPEDIKYENKHYKYIKFNDKDEEDKTPQVEAVGSYNRRTTKTLVCKQQQMIAIGNRLLDWFSVIMADNKRRRQNETPKVKFTNSCKPEAKWMFGHLDANADGFLTSQELYNLEHDQNEMCIKPFLKEICDQDRNNVISAYEWCKCFEKTDRPCAAVRHRLSGDLIATAYAPACDADGFYRPTQCHNSVGICWCVDKHGVEFANTRTRDKPNCDKIADDDDREEEEDDEEASADRILF